MQRGHTARSVTASSFSAPDPVRAALVAGHSSRSSAFAIRTYDGEGQFTQLSNVKGAVIGIEADVESTGTYQVNEDCSRDPLVAVRDGWSGRHRPDS